MIRGLLDEARPKQWAKNVLVFAAPGAAGVLSHWNDLWPTLVAFVAFCLASSGTYYWNDIHDVEADRNHPTKRNRPIAAGVIPLAVARLVGTVLLLGGVGLALVINWQVAAVIGGYVLQTTLYSTVLKHVAVIELVAVAAGFLLRAIAGAEATDVQMSTWFLLCTSFGSLFIVTGKRFAELREMGGDNSTRATLDAYTLQFLQTVLTVAIGGTIVTYCIWAFEAREVSGNDWPFYELSIVPMLIALLRYTLVIEQGHGSAPEEVFMADRWLQAMGLLWVVVFSMGVYVG